MQMEQEHIFNFSNLVTFSRIIIIFIAAYFMLSDYAQLYLIAFFLIIIAVLMDAVDGLVARKFNSLTDFGGIFDILGDRIVENVLWVTFAYIRLVPLWVPVVIISRSFITDGIRNYASSKGKTAFGKKTMMKGNIGIFFVSSRFSRALYAIAKLVTFSLLAFQLYLANISYSNIEIFKQFTYSMVLFTVAFCIIRGVFVVYDGFEIFTSSRSQ